MDDLSFTNALPTVVRLFDSFADDGAGADTSYYGTLTFIGELQPGATAKVPPVQHGPICAVIAFDSEGRPVGRYVAHARRLAPFTVSAADAAAVQHASQFLDYRLANPSADLVKKFDGLVEQGDSKRIDALFAETPTYKDCTFPAYMLALTDRAKSPPKPGQPSAPPEHRTYSLATLCHLMGGGEWPRELPDIAVSNPSFSTKDGVLALAGTIDLRQVTFKPPSVASNIGSFLPLDEVRASFRFNARIGLDLFATSISLVANDFNIPVGGTTLTLARPTVRLDLAPTFMFFKFTASTVIPFNIFGKAFDADVSFVVDNVEAEIGAVVRGDASSLPAPPPMKGVHFDAFGVGVGIIFQPPSYALGIEGKFHIGDGTRISVNKDSFVLVCSMVEGEVPNPVYIAFYLPAVDFPTFVETFTDQRVECDFPVTLRDLAFQWAENPMEPVVLPDGSLTQMAFGCRGYLSLFGLEFYGAIALSLSGVEATLTMSPLAFGSILRFDGQGQGVSLKVDENGNPLDNTQLPKTTAIRQAIAAAPLKEFVVAGGPELIVSTSSQPYFSLTAAVSLFECHTQINVSVNNSGVVFGLNFGEIIQGWMSCRLVDAEHFSASFTFSAQGVTGVSLPTINGFSLGFVTSLSGVTVSFDITLPTLEFNIVASFALAGSGLQVMRFAGDPGIQTLQQLIDRVIEQIRQDAAGIFAPIIANASAWAGLVRTWTIQGVNNTAEGLKVAFGKPLDESASIMQNVGYTLDDAVNCLPPVFHPSAGELTSALRSSFNATENQVAPVLNRLQYGAADAANAIAQVFGRTPDEVNSYLQQAGYPAEQVRNAFQSIGGKFASSGEKIWGSVTDKIADKADPRNWF